MIQLVIHLIFNYLNSCKLLKWLQLTHVGANDWASKLAKTFCTPLISTQNSDSAQEMVKLQQESTQL